jgi:hypothetical protein
VQNAETLLSIIREPEPVTRRSMQGGRRDTGSRHESPESRVRGKLASAVRRGAEGKVPVYGATRQRPTQLGEGRLEKGRCGTSLAAYSTTGARMSICLGSDCSIGHEHAPRVRKSHEWPGILALTLATMLSSRLTRHTMGPRLPLAPGMAALFVAEATAMGMRQRDMVRRI